MAQKQPNPGQVPVFREQRPITPPQSTSPAEIILRAAGLDRQDAALNQKAQDGLREALFTIADLAQKKQAQDAKNAQNKAVIELKTAELAIKKQQMEKVDDPYLKTYELQAFGAPAGTKRSQVAGQVPVSPANRSKLVEIDKALPILDSLDTLSQELNLGESALGAEVKGAVSSIKGLSRTTVEGRYKSARDNIAQLVRAMGESGALATKDVDRILDDLPTFRDSKDSRKARLDRIRTIMNQNKTRLRAAFSGDILGRGGAAGGGGDVASIDAELADIDALLQE